MWHTAILGLCKGGLGQVISVCQLTHDDTCSADAMRRRQDVTASTCTSDWKCRAAGPERVKRAVPLPFSFAFTMAMASSKVSACKQLLSQVKCGCKHWKCPVAQVGDFCRALSLHIQTCLVLCVFARVDAKPFERFSVCLLHKVCWA